MTARPHHETCLGSNVGLGADNAYEIMNCAAVRTATTPELQTRLTQNYGQRDCGQQDEKKKYGLKCLVIAFVLATVIIAGMFVAVFVMMTTLGNKQSTNIEQLKTRLANLENRHASMWYLAGNGFSYKVFIRSRNFSEAEKYCENICTRLASTGIRDASVRKELLNSIVVAETYYWIGLKETNSSIWTWSDGALYTSESTPWTIGHPNNDGDCGIAYNDLDLYDGQCESRYAFLCEGRGTAVQCEDGFVYRGKCYFAIINDRRHIKFHNKDSTCRSRCGRIGNILNLEHQLLAENYVRSRISATNDLTRLWLALVYNSSTRTLATSEGNYFPSASLRWHPGFPRSVPNVLLLVNKNISSPAGVYNYQASASTTVPGVICEN